MTKSSRIGKSENSVGLRLIRRSNKHNDLEDVGIREKERCSKSLRRETGDDRLLGSKGLFTACTPPTNPNQEYNNEIGRAERGRIEMELCTAADTNLFRFVKIL